MSDKSFVASKTGVCPQCGNVCRIESASYGLEAYSCGACGSVGIYHPEPDQIAGAIGALALAQELQRAPPPVPVQPKLPGLDPGRQQRKVKVPEEAVQAQSMRALAAAGYTVQQTTVRFKAQRCKHCNGVHGYNPVDGSGYGTTRGIADLLVRNPRWPPALCIQIEMKGSHTALSEAQEKAFAAQGIFVCRSAAECLAVVRSIDTLLLTLGVE